MIVLIVDDDQVSRRVLKRLLSRFPELDLREAESGDAAWTMLGDIVPAMIIADLSMPGMDGVTLIRKIREHQVFGAIPVVVSSSGKDTDILMQLKDLQILDYLLKPLDLAQAFGRLERHLTPLLNQFRKQQQEAKAEAAKAAKAESEAVAVATESSPDTGSPDSAASS